MGKTFPHMPMYREGFCYVTDKLSKWMSVMQEAINNMGLHVDLEYITDVQKIIDYGIMSVPAIVINGQVVSMGKVLKPVDVENLIQKYEV